MLWILFALGVGASHAQTSSFCQSINPNAIQRMASLPQGTYAAWWPEFTEVNGPSGRKLYAGIMCSTSIHSIQNGYNCIVDLATGKISRAPGWFDGQWVKDPVDESIFTIPNKYPEAKDVALPGLTFFRFQDVLTQGRNAPPLYRDPTFGNHYHSFGLLTRGVDSAGQAYAIHRVVNDKWGVSSKDYKFTLGSRGEVLAIQPMGPERNLTNGPGDTEVVKTSPAQSADPNGNQSYFDLPMISRDGRYFAADNRKTMTTQIFEFTDTGKRLVADVGIETGKLAFAPQRAGSEDLLVAFHIDQIDPAEGDKMTGVHGGMTKDIVMMRLIARYDANHQIQFDPGQIVRVTASGQLGDGNYYPKWVNDHELIYIESRNNNQQTFVKVDADQIQMQNNLVPHPTLPFSSKQYAASASLGLVIASQCTNFAQQLTAKEAALYAVNLTHDTCRQLADQWDAEKSIVQSASEFYSLRPPKAPGSERVPGYNFAESFAQRGAQRYEKTVLRSDISQLTSSDLRAVCDDL